jgi:Ca2+-binding EF-hand superfamily protein
MKIKLTHTEVQNIFNSIDFDLSGAVSFPEFISDFKKTVETDTNTLIMQEKERYESE